MPRSIDILRRILAGGILLLAVMTHGQGPIEDLRLPLEYYTDGTLKTELTAVRADLRPDASIAVSGIVIRVFDTNAVEDLVLEARDAVCSQDRLNALSDNPVAMRRGSLQIKGEGFDWNGTDQTLRIRRQVWVSLPSALLRNGTGDQP